MQRSGVGLQVKLDFFTGLCIFSYKYFAVVDIHTLDHFAVCKQQELRVSSVIPFVQSCMDSHPEIFSIEALRTQYECMGDVPNVVFPCATLSDAATGRITIYYGCADTVTGMAFTTVDELLNYVKENSL